MNNRLDARIEVARGELIIGALTVPMIPDGAAGEWRVGGASGAVLRPLRFGERTRLSSLAAISTTPQASLAAAIARAATVADGAVDDTVREVAALLLSGARHAGGAFGEVLLRVGRAGGWGLDQIVDAPADEVDRLARSLGEPSTEQLSAGASQVRLKAEPTDTQFAEAGSVGGHSWVPASAGANGVDDGGWNRLVFDDGGGAASVAAIRDMLADNLLARLAEHERPAADSDAQPDVPLADSSFEREDPGWPAALAVQSPTPASESAQASPAPAAEGIGDESGPRPPAFPAEYAPQSTLSQRWFTRASRPGANVLEDVAPAHAGVGRADPGPTASPTTIPEHETSWVPASAGTGPVEVEPNPTPSGVAAVVRERRSGPSASQASPSDRLGLGVVRGPGGSLPVSGSPSFAWTPGTLRTMPAQPRESLAQPRSFDALAPDLADALAMLLHEEADLRGLE